MQLGQYFEHNQGTGILATADKEGRVDAALYARPHVVDETTVAFIMRHRQSYKNILENPRASYLFNEERPGYQGKRLYLTRIGEQTDKQVVESRRRRARPSDDEPKSLVFFHIDSVRPLIGSDSDADVYH
jgi:hypothetical protein